MGNEYFTFLFVLWWLLVLVEWSSGAGMGRAGECLEAGCDTGWGLIVGMGVGVGVGVPLLVAAPTKFPLLPPTAPPILIAPLSFVSS